MRLLLLIMLFLGSGYFPGGADPDSQLLFSALKRQPRLHYLIHRSLIEPLSKPLLSISRPPDSLVLSTGARREFDEELRAARASGVLLDWHTGNLLAEEGEQRTATPGSLLKPFLLAYALQHLIVKESTQVYCRRTLHVAGRSLPCSHPNDRPMLDAESALANSCNTWFAALARRMAPGEMKAVLAQAGLPHTHEHFDDADTRVLAALGLQDVTATPMQIAMGYRALLFNEPHTSAVWRGLRGSVAYGMASNARVEGVELLGKTGTANNPGEWWAHGWFAGGVPGRFVLVIYVPRGDGGTAATLAGAFVRRMASEHKQ